MPSASVRVERLQFTELRIPFKAAFRHASAERAETETVLVEALAADGTAGRGESCPRAYVTGETVDSARTFLEQHRATICREIDDVESLRAWVISHRGEIDRHPAAWCALELALLDLFGRSSGATVESLLSLPALAGNFHYTAVLGDASPGAFHGMAERYWSFGFRDFKVKLSGDHERDREKLTVCEQWPAASARVRADANNVWGSGAEARTALQQLGHEFFAVEEPIGRDRYAELSDLSRALNCPVILDESCVRREQVSRLPGPRSQWLINLRVSKMGGIIRSLEVVDAARAAGIGVIVGAQVGETSILTRAALPVARAAGGALVAQEGAFGTFLLERDVCEPPLMFGAGGVLDVAAYPMLTGPGLGLSGPGCQGQRLHPSAR